VTRIKICGVTSVEQAVACIELGADALGVNFVDSSPRRVDVGTARTIALAIGTRALVVGVVADLSVAAMRALVTATRVGCLQLHGDEPAEDVATLLPHAYKAIRVASEEDVRRAESMPGEFVMVDAKVAGVLGGSGHLVDWSLVKGLAKRRKLVLAGGLTAENVAAAVTSVRPWCVDVASGVEVSPGVKDLAKVKALVEAVRAAGVWP
jgi:phosphoribosylanthranilate isomerase